MSDTDSFIDEVTEEVRRDRLFALLRKYGWIAVLVILLIVGGATFNEFRKAQATAEAEALGDALLAALASNDAADRAEGLRAIEAESPGARAITQLLFAANESEADDPSAAIAALNEVAATPDLPPIYTTIASFKSLLLQSDTLPGDDRRIAFEAMAQPGAPLRLLAEEQLALIEIETGAPEAALDRLQAILVDAEAGAALQDRVTRLILALGGQPATRPDNTQQG